MQLDTTQQQAVDLLLANHSPHRPGRLAGFAGTGKTACIGAALDRANGDGPLVLTPTHRARLALAKVGIEAQTIHSAIYVPVEPRSIEDITSDIAQHEHLLDQAQRNHVDADRAEVLARLEKRLADLRRELETDVKFLPREENAVLGQHVIIDEASMVGGRLLADVVAAGPASLTLVGDPAQLPPVQDTDPFREVQPDVQLEHVYRHDGWILAAATAVRQDNEYEAYRIVEQQGRVLDWRRRINVRAVLTEAGAEDYIEICWRRRTRLARNAEIRDMASRVDGAGQPHPMQRQGRERVCCEASPPRWWQDQDMYRSAWSLALDGEPPRNGTLGWFDGQVIETDTGRRVQVVDEDKKHMPIAWAKDLSPTASRKEICNRWLWNGGWILTAHKAQGAQWTRVSVVDEYDKAGDVEGRRRWLYTAMTRAKDDLIWWRQG